MTTPNLDAQAQQAPEQEPEGIRMLRQEYSPEKVEEILAGIRRGIDDYENGRYITLEDYLKECGETEDELMDAYLERHGLTRDDIK